MKIEVTLKNVYGQERFYPTNSDAIAICTLMKSKTLTKEELKFCRASGWPVEIKLADYILE